jgi:ATP phosphoribosyltransferase regulatory subunit
MIQRNSIGLPGGFRDLLFEDAKSRRMIENTFAGVLAGAGYREIIPSGVEFAEIYARGHQSMHERTFKFLDREDNLLALRGDFTPAVARIVAGRLRDAPPPFRVWYSGSVFRKADRHRGQFNEFHQIGCELIGANATESDAEVLDVALRSLTGAGVADACVHVNHAGVFRGIVSALALDAGALATVKSEIDRKDMRALGLRLEEVGVAGVIRSQVAVLSRCIGDAGVLAGAAAAVDNPESAKAIRQLAELAGLLPEWKERIVFDLTEIDEMEYYTGAMFTFFSPSHSGELGKGGRYDGLLREFGADLPAVGFSLSLDRISECL